MMREELLDEICKVKRVCRGLPLFDQHTRDTLTGELNSCRTDADRAVIVQQMAGLLGLASLDISTDAHTVQSLIYSFKENCGRDFNAVISTYPFDGQIRDVNCPGCGAPQHFQSPLVG
jgi:hypothetical protein